MTEFLGSDAVNVEPSKDLLNYLAEVMLSLYTQLAYALYNHLRYNTFNKSARVHYALMFYLILNCKPKLYEFDITQQSALRYLLLPKKTIDESLSILKSKKTRVKRPILDETVMDIHLSSDDDDNTTITETVKRKRSPRTPKTSSTKEPVKRTRKPRTKKGEA